MFNFWISIIILISTTQAHQKLGPQEHATLSREQILNELGLNLPINSGRPALCEPQNCKKIEGVTDKLSLVAAVNGSCFHLVNTYANTQCGRDQERIIRTKLSEFKSVKKAGYKHRALAAEAEVVRLGRLLLRAQTKLHNIDARLTAYLIRLGEVPDASTHQKITQIQEKIEALRQQILAQERELLARQERIDDLDAQNQAQAEHIVNLQADNAAKDQEIGRLNQEVDDLSLEFAHVVNQTIDLKVVVRDFGLEIEQYTDQMTEIQGTLREKLHQFQAILQQLNTGIANQTDQHRAEFNQNLTDLRQQIVRLTDMQRALGDDVAYYQQVLDVMSNGGNQ